MFGTFLEKLAAAVPGQWERVFATAILVGIGLLAAHLWARYLARGEISPEKRRIHLVWARNVIWFVIFLIIVSVWASTIAGFALSLAAVTGALLIVSKEVVMCVHGYLYITVVKPFKVGDVIQFNGLHGRVIDIDVFATTLVTLDDVSQPTGKIAVFPNGLLLTTPLTNVSLTGEFALHAIRIPISQSFARDLERVEAAAMEAAERATESWREKAIEHFRKVSEEHFIVFPSGRSKVLWDFSDPEHLVLVVRVACPSKDSARVEQLVFKDMWRNLAELRQS